MKQDIDNIRAGRLDLIAERQEKDDEAKKTSIIEIVKEVHHHHHYDRWYEPYKIIFKEPYYKPYGYIDDWTICDAITDADSVPIYCNTVSNSVAKSAYAGTYQLKSGDCITLT
ncbi:hypothetical protein ES708_33699 [subsurface metagenome]